MRTTVRKLIKVPSIIPMLSQVTQIMNLSEDEIQSHPSLIVNVLNKEHQILLWNKQSELYFGISKEDALGKTLEEIVPEVINNPKMVFLARALAGESVYISDGHLEKTGMPCSQLVLPIKDNFGNVIAALNIVRPLPSKPEHAGLSNIRLFSQVIF